MKRGTKCVVQTINLSNPKTYKRPKVKTVTSANVNSRNRASARSAAVKVYSWKDAQWRYPSKPCEPFPEKSRPSMTSSVLYRTVVFFIKGAIVACLICWTCTEGLWGSSAETEELYYRMMSVIFPDQQVNKQTHFKEIKYSVFQTYNNMLMKGMDVMISVPRDAYRRLQEFFSPCSETNERERRRNALTRIE